MEVEPYKTMQILKKYNQEHLLDFYDELTEDEQKILISEINSIDFEKINELYINSYLDDSISSDRISALPYVSKQNFSKEELANFSEIGNNLIKQEKLAIITLAGGQGTRLGYKGPKGTYEIDIPPKKSLFEFVCDKLKAVKNSHGALLNWYIMTSPANDLATKNYFKEHYFFGYPENKIKFFMQDTFPIIDTSSKVILDSPYSIKSGANGNGDVFKAFASAGLVEDLDKNNIDWIFIGGIDNILSQIADPIFLGLACNGNYPIASKSIAKADVFDHGWVFANVDGRPTIIDSQNLTNDILTSTNENGQLLYNQKNIVAHLFTTEAFKQLVNINLPYHRAFKKSDFINSEGMKEVATVPNSFKFEKFIFDGFSEFDKMLLLEVNADEEFAPIKSFTGNATPETALELYKKYHNIV